MARALLNQDKRFASAAYPQASPFRAKGKGASGASRRAHRKRSVRSQCDLSQVATDIINANINVNINIKY